MAITQQVTVVNGMASFIAIPFPLPVGYLNALAGAGRDMAQTRQAAEGAKGSKSPSKAIAEEDYEAACYRMELLEASMRSEIGINHTRQWIGSGK